MNCFYEVLTDNGLRLQSYHILLVEKIVKMISTTRLGIKYWKVVLVILGFFAKKNVLSFLISEIKLVCGSYNV